MSQEEGQLEIDEASWKQLVKEGREARKQKDAACWYLGGLAIQVAGHSKLDRESKYGENALERYADEIGENPGTLREYRRVAERFPIRIGNLGFSHHQAAASLVPWDEDSKRFDNALAVSLLEQADRERWSVPRLSQEVQAARPPHHGRHRPSPEPEDEEMPDWLDLFTTSVGRISADDIRELDPQKVVAEIVKWCGARQVEWFERQVRQARYILADTDMVLEDEDGTRLGQCLSCGRTVPWGIYTCRDCWRDRQD